VHIGQGFPKAGFPQRKKALFPEDWRPPDAPRGHPETGSSDWFLNPMHLPSALARSAAEHGGAQQGPQWSEPRDSSCARLIPADRPKPTAVAGRHSPGARAGRPSVRADAMEGRGSARRPDCKAHFGPSARPFSAKARGRTGLSILYPRPPGHRGMAADPADWEFYKEQLGE
jgi:hypothetical protein